MSTLTDDEATVHRGGSVEGGSVEPVVDGPGTDARPNGRSRIARYVLIALIATVPIAAISAVVIFISLARGHGTYGPPPEMP